MKLAAQPQHLPGLIRLLEARAGTGLGPEIRLVSTYFDTQDGALARQGLTLRIREQEGRFVQTVKSGGGPCGADGNGAALVRGEWEDPVSGAFPDPQAPQTGFFIPAQAADDLVALVRTDIKRRVVMLCPEAETRIEAAVDQGQVAALHDDLCEPVCEIELELKDGGIAPLYEFALEMLAVAPVRLERSSKSARGFRLAGLPFSQEPAAAVQAEAVELDPGMTAGAALRRIVHSCLEQILGNEAVALAGIPEGVHQMRVGVRRLRAFLSAFAPLLSGDHKSWMSNELRWLGEILGVARNLDVFADGLMAPAAEAIGDSDGFAALQEAVAGRRAAARADAAAAIRSPRYTALVLRLLRWAEGDAGQDARSPDLSRPLAEIGSEILDRRLAVVQQRAAGFARQSPEQRHRLRIALKKLRYPLEILGSLYDEQETGRMVRVIKRLQEVLGDANDAHTASDLVAELAHHRADTEAIAEAGAAVLDWHARQLALRDSKTGKHVAEIREQIAFW